MAREGSHVSPPDNSDNRPSAVRDASANRWLAAVVSIYVAIQIFLLFSTAIKPMTGSPAGRPQILVGAGPDEQDHYQYILAVAAGAGLPAAPGYRTRPGQPISHEAQQPPLYYLLAGAVCRLASSLPSSARFLFLRGLSIPFGCIIVVMASLAARYAVPNNRVVIYGMPAAIAFLPQFSYMTATMSNQPMANAISCTAWCIALRHFQQAAEQESLRALRPSAPSEGRSIAHTPSGKESADRTAVVLGLVLGLAGVCRLTELVWLPAIAVILVASRPADGFPRQMMRIGVLCVLLLAVMSPWLLYNETHYSVPVFRTDYRPLLGRLSLFQYLADPSQTIHPVHSTDTFSEGLLGITLWFCSTSWFPCWLEQFFMLGYPQTIYAWQAPFLIFNVAFLLLLFLHASRMRRIGATGTFRERIPLLAAGLAVALIVLALIYEEFYSDYLFIYYAGRYTASAMAASVLLAVFALSTTTRTPRQQRGMVAAITGCMLFSDLLSAALIHIFYILNKVT